MQVSKAWCQVHAEPVQNAEVGHVNAVHVARYGGGHNVGRVVIADVEYPLAFMMVCTQ